MQRLNGISTTTYSTGRGVMPSRAGTPATKQDDKHKSHDAFYKNRARMAHFGAVADRDKRYT